MADQGRVIFIDDELPMRMAVEQWLGLAGFAVSACESAEAAGPLLSPEFPGVVVSDVKMPRMDGVALLKEILGRDADLPVILVTGHGDVPLAVEAIRLGAYDFIEKPFAPERLVETVRRACEKRRLVMENRRLRREAAARQDIAARLIGTSRAMEAVRAEILDLAPTSINVVILGETGAGKEVAARCLHDFSPRAERPFVAVNCAAIPEAMFESEFFGHEAGAYTGAAGRRAGKVEYASGGTLFLDEVESMPMALQAKLLRTLQERSVEPLGGNRSIPVDLRTITAAKGDLLERVRKGGFREDLYYRLAVAEIRLPPLRERKEDIPLLFQFFADQAAALHGRDPRPLQEPLLRELQSQDWPGNVRELRNAAERYALGIERRRPAERGEAAAAGSLQEQVSAFERQVIEKALQDCRGDIREVLRRLDLPRRTLNEKMARYGLQRGRFLRDGA